MLMFFRRLAFFLYQNVAMSNMVQSSNPSIPALVLITSMCHQEAFLLLQPAGLEQLHDVIKEQRTESAPIMDE